MEIPLLIQHSFNSFYINIYCINNYDTNRIVFRGNYRLVGETNLNNPTRTFYLQH